MGRETVVGCTRSLVAMFTDAFKVKACVVEGLLGMQAGVDLFLRERNVESEEDDGGDANR